MPRARLELGAAAGKVNRSRLNMAHADSVVHSSSSTTPFHSIQAGCCTRDTVTSIRSLTSLPINIPHACTHIPHLIQPVRPTLCLKRPFPADCCALETVMTVPARTHALVLALENAIYTPPFFFLFLVLTVLTGAWLGFFISLAVAAAVSVVYQLLINQLRKVPPQAAVLSQRTHGNV